MAVLKRTQSKGTPGLEVAVVDLDVFMRMIKTIEDLANVAFSFSHELMDDNINKYLLDPWGEYIANG